MSPRWRDREHAHCHCGSRLVEQIPDGLPPICIDCGYHDEECRCDVTPCQYCGRVDGGG